MTPPHLPEEGVDSHLACEPIYKLPPPIVKWALFGDGEVERLLSETPPKKAERRRE